MCKKTQTSSFKANVIFASLRYDTQKHMKKFKKKVYFDLLPKGSEDDPASEDYSTLAEYRHVAQALQLQHTMLLQISRKKNNIIKIKIPPLNFLANSV